MRGKATLAEVWILLAAFFVGTDVVSVKYALEGFPPLVLMPIRYVPAGLLLLASLRLLRRRIGLAPRDLAALAGLGLVGVSLNQVGYTVGLSLTGGSNAALIFASAPVWGLLLGAVLRLERPTWGRPGSRPRLRGRSAHRWRGLGSRGGDRGRGSARLPERLLVGGLRGALHVRIAPRLEPLVVGAGRCSWAAAVLPLAFAGYPGLSEPLSSVGWAAAGAAAWTAAAYSTMLCSAFAIAAWQASVARLGANRALVYLYLVTLVAVLASVVLLGDSLGAGKIAGAAAILLGVYLARRA